TSRWPRRDNRPPMGSRRWGWAVLAIAIGLAHPASRAVADTTAAEAYAEARAALAAGNYDDALAAADAGLSAAANDVNLLRLRGEILLQKRDFEGALTAYEAFLAAGPRGANARKARRIVQDLAAVRS